MWSSRTVLGCSLLFAAIAAGCDDRAIRDAEDRGKSARDAATKASVKATATAEAAAPQIDKSDLGFFKVVPAKYESQSNPITDAKVALGKALYYENRLSLGQNISCNSCHDLEKYGVDNEATSAGHKGQRGGRNSPTVYNAAGHIAQFWDGRASTVEDQAKGPILNPIEMAMPDAAAVIKVIKSIPGYEPMFKAAFPGERDPITYDNLAKAIGAFERQLTTPSRWDKFLGGDEKAITDLEKAGFAKFAKLGCPTCHNGSNVGGHLFQKLGLVNPWPDQADLGRYDVTKNDSDKMFFRVPSLRNIEKTGPYFHKGQLATLEETVKAMAWHQLGQKLSDQDTTELIAFLKSLTGEIPKEYIAKPELPPSGPTTPKPKLD
ncbi:MAG: c-type cytochrome [Polyangiaceae bacterium]|nr:c-type cytochrome [Polyangiaceae bacterium]